MFDPRAIAYSIRDQIALRGIDLGRLPSMLSEAARRGVQRFHPSVTSSSRMLLRDGHRHLTAEAVGARDNHGVMYTVIGENEATPTASPSAAAARTGAEPGAIGMRPSGRKRRHHDRPNAARTFGIPGRIHALRRCSSTAKSSSESRSMTMRLQQDADIAITSGPGRESEHHHRPTAVDGRPARSSGVDVSFVQPPSSTEITAARQLQHH